MPPSRRVRGILLDSGDTLVRPIGGRWWPPLAMRDLLLSGSVPDLRLDRLDQALKKANRYLDENHHLTTEDEEREQFRSYNRILLKELGLASPAEDLIESLSRATAEGPEFEPYPDTHAVLKRMHERGIPLGLVSNAWPSLERKYRCLGLRQYFKAFVISARVGSCKPDERIYVEAINAIGLPPEDLLFVDDVPEYIEKAIDMGMQGVVMVRDGQPPQSGLQWICELAGIEAFV